MTSSRPAALIVEDQAFIGLIASDILCESGFDTFHAHTAADAVSVLGEHPEIAVVVADAQLPGSVDGLEFVRRVARDRPDVRLVVTSAGADLALSQVPAGARVLHKPYASGELKVLVATEDLLQDA
jgi:CheY-like chemotaxis protein